MRTLILFLFVAIIYLSITETVNGKSSNSLETFYVSEKWPKCSDVFEDIQSQGDCSSSWAISVASSIRDRRCIEYGIKEPLSAYDLISCCSDCQIDGKNGCNGGDHHSAFYYFQNTGIVTGGSFNSNQGCKPYPISPDLSAPKPTSTKCEQKCQPSYKRNDYQHDKFKGLDTVLFSGENDEAMNEIFENGPVVVEFELYPDFLNYSGGIYKHKGGKSIGYYHAKILGWGHEGGKLFWKAAASFGPNWGENGTFRIARDTNECGFESNIIGGIIQKPASMNCQKITAYYTGTFQYPEDRTLILDADLQIKVDINLEKQRMYISVDGYNKSYAPGYGFRVFNLDKSVVCNSTEQKECSNSFDELPWFLIWFWPLNNYGYNPDLIRIDYMENKQFTLEKVVGNCARSLKGDAPSDTDSSLYKRCFCCGDKYNPDPSLECPVSPWA